MFGFFNQNKFQVEVADKIWLSKTAKWNACIKMARVNSSCIFVAWFQDTMRELLQVIGDDPIKSRIVLAKDFKTASENVMYIFLEHHPLSSREQALFVLLDLKEAPVLSSLEDPLFTIFGGERMVRLMENLGMEDDEIIGHSMINQAIRKAQTKIEKKISREVSANSQEEWFEKNWHQNR